jgi:hypothetical protein
MTPDEFVSAWDTPLVKLPKELHVPTRLNADAVRFLNFAGLPARVAYGDRTWPAHLSFASVEHGVLPLPEVLAAAGVQCAESWSPHFVIGEEWFAGGASPFWCVHGPSGRVEVIDIEADDESPSLVNTSIAHLADTLLRFRSWVRAAPSAGRDLRGLRDALQRADPAAWRTSRWSELLDHLESVDAGNIVCEADTANRRTGSGADAD